MVERGSGDRARLRLRLAAGRRPRDRLALRVVSRAHRDGEREGDPRRREGPRGSRGAGRRRPHPGGQADDAAPLLPGDDDLRDPLSRPPGDHRGPRGGLDGPRQHGVERRLRARGGGAERVPHARQEPDVLGRRPGDHREGDRPRHQRRQPGPHPLPGRGARPPRAPPARPVPGPPGGAARRGDERPPPLLLLLRLQPHREREPGPSRRTGAARPFPRHRPGRHRRTGAQGRPVAGLQLHPLQDRRLRDAGHPLREAHPGGARRRGEAALRRVRSRGPHPEAHLQHLREPQADRDGGDPDVEAEARGDDGARELRVEDLHRHPPEPGVRRGPLGLVRRLQRGVDLPRPPHHHPRVERREVLERAGGRADARLEDGGGPGPDLR